MASPPTKNNSTSVSRSRASAAEIRSWADEMLLSSASRSSALSPASPPPPYTKSSASISRSRGLSGGIRSAEDSLTLLRPSQNPSSSATSSPPPYSTSSSSVSRLRTSSAEFQASADIMLQASVASKSPPVSLAAALVPPDSDVANPTSRAGKSAAASRLYPSPGLGSVRAKPPTTSSSSLIGGLALKDRTRQVNVERKRHEYVGRQTPNGLAGPSRPELRDGAASRLSAADARSRVLELNRASRALAAKAKPKSTAGIVKRLCSTDLLFLMDTTGSMGRYIEAAKDQVRKVVSDLRTTFLHEAEIRVAVVAYKDHGMSPPIQFLDFTSSIERVHAFLDTLYAGGELAPGDRLDEPEDVLGGLRQAINASWVQPVRCIMHIADAPPHGRVFQNMKNDRYPDGEPHGLTYEPLVTMMSTLHINYTLLRIKSTTDRMSYLFSQIYARASARPKLHKDNSSSDQVSESYTAGGTQGRGASKSSFGTSLLFEELELGTSYQTLRHLVVKSVTASATNSASRTLEALSDRGWSEKKRSEMKKLTAVREGGFNGGEPDDGPELEADLPQWDAPGWLDETFVATGFSPEVVLHGANTLPEMMALDENIRLSYMELTLRRRSRPFAAGAMRLASYARTAVAAEPFVIKSFKRGGKRIEHLAAEMRCQALCKAFALEFSALAGEENALDFIVTTCLEARLGPGAGNACVSLEPYIPGRYEKYNNNAGWVNGDIPDDPINQAAQAFSHFTFERSWGRFLVCDLQGVGRLLTDPGVHAKDPERFKECDANLGEAGMKLFFTTHECNDICRKLELRSNRDMLISGKHEFRERWPSIDATVCCASKLCGRIIRTAGAQRSDEFPGHYWCQTCWPQLFSSKVLCACTAPRLPSHQFTASGFFHESQGQQLPMKCPEHREKDTNASKSKFWESMKSETKSASLSGSNW